MLYSRVSGPFRVYISLIASGYQDPRPIRAATRDGIIYCRTAATLESLGRGTSSDVLLKPSVVLADPVLARNAHTHAEVVSATMAAILSFAPGARLSLLCEENFLGLSSRGIYRRAGYRALERGFGSRLKIVRPEHQDFAFYLLSKEETLGASIVRAPALHAEAGFRVYCPKIRTDVLSGGFAGAVRLGIENPADSPSESAICDFLEICSPDLVVGDAILTPIGGGRATQQALDLGVLLVANNALAHDWVTATILNLDPLHIPHLRMAMERGWGPSSLKEIEIGGAGEAAVRALSQKTRAWKFGIQNLAAYKPAFERDNPGLRFPLEILATETGGQSNSETPRFGARGVLLDSLNMACDSPKIRQRISRWPRATLCAGRLSAYPKNFLVFAFGSAAADSLAQITSSKQVLFRLFGIELARGTLKNARHHLLVSVERKREFPSYWKVAIALFVGSGGRIRLPILNARTVAQAAGARLRFFAARIAGRRPTRKSNLVMTGRMQQNAWWSLGGHE
ncbi:MAG: DUF362 domain-containing protein [Deltaproteobacteria bacterium]|nr:DUF362 domain-containing protein [Deltaproteobacteria bacterium]